MRPKFLTVESIYDADHWNAGKEFHVTGFREAVANRADSEGLAIIGHEILRYTWMVKDGDTYRARDRDNGATHVKVTYERQAVSRQIRA